MGEIDRRQQGSDTQSQVDVTDLPRVSVALVWTFVVATMVAGMLWPVAAYFPLILTHFILRTFIALIVCVVLFAVVQAKAGVVGWKCTLTAVGLAFAVMLSQHVAFALYGVPTRTELVSGYVWIEPPTVLFMNFSSAIGIGFATLLCHSGNFGLGDLLGLLGQDRWGGPS